MVFPLLTFVFAELFGADESLRGQARQLDAVGADLKVTTGGLPPEAQAALDSLRGLSGQLERAQRWLTSAGRALGETAADARAIDLNGLDVAKALVLLAAGEVPQVLLRAQGKRLLARHRADVRHHLKILRQMEHNGASVRQIRARRKLLEKSQKALRLTKHDIRKLRLAGISQTASSRTLRALKQISSALGLKLPAAALSAREWHRAARNAGSLRKAIGERAYARILERRQSLSELRHLSPDRTRAADGLGDSAKRLLGRRAGGAIPLIGGGADAAVTGLDAKKFWDDPSLGNGANLAADLLYDVGNIPLPPTLIIGNGGGALVDGTKLVVDNAGEIKDFADDHVPDVTPWDGLSPVNIGPLK
ncbi:MAG: hypothetical protein ACRDT6_25995 [Micromonosporaceae bacterium]